MEFFMGVIITILAFALIYSLSRWITAFATQRLTDWLVSEKPSVDRQITLSEEEVLVIEEELERGFHELERKKDEFWEMLSKKHGFEGQHAEIQTEGGKPASIVIYDKPKND